MNSDGTLWASGTNNFGQLGQGHTTNRSSPVQIGALTTWAEVCGGEQNMAMAVKTDGTLWSWGANSAGQLGLGNTTNYSSPKQVGALATWSKVTAIGSASLSLKTDGTLWAWGYNAQGQLGQGNTTNTSSPVQVGGLTNWSAIANSVGGSVFALKTDGTLWAWGGNPYGELGTNNTTYYSSPVQIGALTTWSKVAGGSRTGQAIKTDGTLWTWGRNASGQLGQGNTTDYSSPVQIGALTTWSVLGNQNTSTTVHFIKTP